MDEFEDQELWQSIKLKLDYASAQQLIPLLDESDPLEGLAGYYEVLYDKSLPDDDHTIIMLYFYMDCWHPELQIQILLTALDITGFEIEASRLERQDYMQAYKEHYITQQISARIFIVPSWEAESWQPPDAKSIPIYLDPGLAFGTGRHPTTRLCLEFMEQLPLQGLRLIDAGCGSGVLSIAALLLGAQSVLAFDIDRNAIMASRQNAALNQDRFTGELHLLEGGFDSPELMQAQADMLLGNLTASILIQNVSFLAQATFSHMLLSGIIDQQAELLLSKLEPAWHILEHREQESWLLYYLERKQES